MFDDKNQKFKHGIGGLLYWIALVATLPLCLSCSASDDNSGRDPNGGTDTEMDDAGTDTSTDTEDIDHDAGSTDDPVDAAVEGCVDVQEEASIDMVPGDLIIAVDNSASMDLECGWVRTNLNDFAVQVNALDIHIGLITFPKGIPLLNGICIDAPLGSGKCPNDTNLPRYKHIPQGVGSNDALDLIISTYDKWKTILRPDAKMNFLVVSDDNSDPMTASGFRAALATLDPPIEDFVFHGITASKSLLEAPCKGVGFNAGQVYHDLANQTGGVNGDLCLQEFEPVFDAIAESMLLKSVSCQWPIPDPPPGQTLDPKKVNVVFTDGDGKEHVIGYNQSEADCETSTKKGWYYDDPINPTKIIACPDTCTFFQSDPDGSVAIQLGCETVVNTPV
jgi:hypothetical protein